MDLVPQPKSGTGRLWKNKTDFFRPFRTAAAQAGENIEPLYDPSLRHEQLPLDKEVGELNDALETLVDVFPDVEFEVLREMLMSVSPNSRIELVAEGMLKKQKKRKEGRRKEEMLREEDRFRSESYKKAVKQVFYQEFRSLSHSTIKGVLAEQNFSYSLARPILQQVTSRAWRFFSISSFWSRSAGNAEGHPFIVWKTDGGGSVRNTGSEELDRELYELFVEPVAVKQEQERLQADFEKAAKINEQEAEEAGALFDCECCYGSVPFESVATCDDGCHILCLDCIRRTVNEALYGQGWARTADLQHNTVRCFAPTSTECNGIIPPDLVRRSLTQGTNNDDTWQEFQTRITIETLLKSGLPLQRCPFCSYAETNDLPPLQFKSPMGIFHHLKTKAPPDLQILFIILFFALSLFTVPLLCLAAGLWLLCSTFPSSRNPIKRSITRVHKSRLPHRFQCLNPSCSRLSCTACHTPYRPGHICFESEKLSLRTTLESAASAAVKRTCPRCMLSFVKSSGCNKLVCNCGYTMCYICRSEITAKEGYGHFCQHFRPHGGVCGECERCDLYGDEDEAVIVRKATVDAEQAWREKHGGEKGESGSEAKRMVEVLMEQGRREWWEGWMNGVLDVVLA